MTQKTSTLLQAFHDDHAVLGRGFGSLSAALRARQIGLACEIARTLDAAAGAHIAFEEQDFYPKLKDTLGEGELTRLYDEHRQGFAVIGRLLHLPAGESPDEGQMAEMIARSEKMEQHIAECGDLFQALAALPRDEQTRLLERLLEWRARQPRWQDLNQEP